MVDSGLAARRRVEPWDCEHAPTVAGVVFANLASPDGGTARRDALPARDPGTTGKAHVLLIDDDIGTLGTLVPFFELAGFNVTAVTSGAAGLAAMRVCREAGFRRVTFRGDTISRRRAIWIAGMPRACGSSSAAMRARI